MNNWWLKLYTIPQLTKVARAVGLVTLVVIAAGLLPDKYYLISGSFYFYPIYLYLSDRVSILDNLDFHRLSISNDKLHKIIFLEFLISATGFVLLLVTGMLVPVLIYDKAPIIDSSLEFFVGTVSYTILNVVYLFVIIFNIKYFALMKRRMTAISKAAVPLKNSKRNTRIMLGIGVAVLSFLFLFDEGPEEVSKPVSFVSYLDSVEASSDQVLFIAVLATYTFIGLFFVRSFLDNYRSTKNKTFGAKDSIFAYGGVFGIYFVLGLLASMEMTSPFYSVENRLSTMSRFSFFSPKLESHEVQEFLAKDPSEADMIFSKAGPELWQMPITSFYKDKDLRVYFNYLRHGKPSAENLSYINNVISKANDKEKKRRYYMLVNMALVHYSGNEKQDKRVRDIANETENSPDSK